MKAIRLRRVGPWVGRDGLLLSACPPAINLCALKHALILLVVSSLPWTACATPPANDNFDSPAVIDGFPATAHGSNIEATVESGESLPDGYEFYAVRSVWFSWTAPTSGLVQIDTFGSHADGDWWDPDFPLFKPNPSVWTGDSLETLVEVRCGGTQQSRYLNVASGTAYRIAVFGLANDSLDRGQIVLRIANDDSARISGAVTDTNGVPLSGILVQANHENEFGNWYGKSAWAFTDEAGNYAIRGLSNGTYRVGFYDWAHRESFAEYITEFYDDVCDEPWYDGSPDEAGVTDLVIANGESISGIDAALADAAEISGTVTGPDGTTPLEGIAVYCWPPGFSLPLAWALTDQNGRYFLGGLAPDAYDLRIDDDGDNFIGWHGHVVAESARLTMLGVSLALASKISGTVTGPDGVTLWGVSVSAYRWSGSDWEWWYPGIDYDWIDSAGAYTVGGLTAGVYRIEFFVYFSAGDFVGEFYDDVDSLEAARDIVVPAVATVTGFNAQLEFARPELVSLQAGTNGMDVVFAGVEGRDYILQRGDLASNVWVDVGSPITCVFGNNVLNDDTSAPWSFWRVRRYGVFDFGREGQAREGKSR